MINICLINHTIIGKRSLLDWVEWLNINLNKNGIKCIISKNIKTDAINIIFDNFFLDSYYYLKKYKIKYGVIETEYPINGTFNNINNEAWKQRRYSFDQAAKNALFIWSMGKWIDYQEKIKPKEIVMTYTPELSKWDELEETNKQFDFVFTGPLNEFRISILKKFEESSNLKVHDGFLSRKNYEKLVSQSKYYLCLQQSDDWPTISVSKMMRALHNKTIPILLDSKYLKNFEMANYSIKIDKNIMKSDIENLLSDYDKNSQILINYKSLKKDNFSKLKEMIFINKENFKEKNNIIFPNYNLSQPTAKNQRIIKKGFKLIFLLSKIFKKL